ncbi:NBR1-Ig-like domain-containing protein [Micromonospora narathiwatensis]|nr:NBR1-Ig-like domain-containing protein [Micromonospora narathiwatensis]
MSTRLGAAASKSSLAAAAQGRSLPSWETTWEFVRVLAVDRLGRDPSDTEKEWRERWMQARAAGHSAGTASAADAAPEPRGAAEASTVSDGTPTAETSETEEPRPAGGDSGARRGGRAAPAAAEPAPARLPGRRRVGIAGLAAHVAVLGGVVVLAFVALDRRGANDGGKSPAIAVNDHDDSRFEGDITYPDGTLVPPNTSFTKIWRIRNTGTVVWANRSLARINDEPCQAPKTVAIPQTMPGEAVDIAVSVRTPGTPGSCKIYWKMADEDGRMFFPLKRPIFLDVRVGGS